MWLAPWDNDVHGGDQLAHGLWAFSTGGPCGSGPGWGDPEMIPAGNTDLVLPAIGEEWGFVGVAAVFLLFGFLVARALRGRRALRHAFRILPGAGTGQPDRLRDDADQLGRAGRAAAFGRGLAVPQLRQHRHAGQLPGLRAAAFHLRGRTAGRAPHELLRGPRAYLKAVLACAALVLLAVGGALPGVPGSRLPGARRARLRSRTASSARSTIRA